MTGIKTKVFVLDLNKFNKFTKWKLLLSTKKINRIGKPHTLLFIKSTRTDVADGFFFKECGFIFI